MTEPTNSLHPIDRQVHLALLTRLIETGRLPSPAELAATAGVDRAEVPARLAVLAAADYLCLNAFGGVVCLYPLSPTPTPHLVIVDGRRQYAMCAVDAVGIAAMTGKEVRIESECGTCHDPVTLRMTPGQIHSVQPAGAVVVAHRDGDEPAADTCCPSTLFACNPEHGQNLAARLPGTGVITLTQAREWGEMIFADFLGESLPTHRRRIPRFYVPTGR